MSAPPQCPPPRLVVVVSTTRTTNPIIIEYPAGTAPELSQITCDQHASVIRQAAPAAFRALERFAGCRRHGQEDSVQCLEYVIVFPRLIPDGSWVWDGEDGAGDSFHASRVDELNALAMGGCPEFRA